MVHTWFGTKKQADEENAIIVPPTISTTGLPGSRVGLERATWLSVIVAGKVAPLGALPKLLVQLFDTNRLQFATRELENGSTVK
jgi:hypothetical protein